MYYRNPRSLRRVHDRYCCTGMEVSLSGTMTGTSFVAPQARAQRESHLGVVDTNQKRRESCLAGWLSSSGRGLARMVVLCQFTPKPAKSGGGCHRAFVSSIFKNPFLSCQNSFPFFFAALARWVGSSSRSVSPSSRVRRFLQNIDCSCSLLDSTMAFTSVQRSASSRGCRALIVFALVAALAISTPTSVDARTSLTTYALCFQQLSALCTRKE